MTIIIVGLGFELANQHLDQNCTWIFGGSFFVNSSEWKKSTESHFNHFLFMFGSLRQISWANWSAFSQLCRTAQTQSSVTVGRARAGWLVPDLVVFCICWALAQLVTPLMFLLDCHFASRQMMLQVSNILDNCTPLATCNQLTLLWYSSAFVHSV